jgi:hypothetical protein
LLIWRIHVRRQYQPQHKKKEWGLDQAAARGKKLTSLDHAIREGNSVISDPAVHPKAFDWQAAFPEVFAQGGFDVVVSNSPYIRQELLAPFKPYWEQRFKSYHGVADIFTYFFEHGVELPVLSNNPAHKRAKTAQITC